MILPAHPLPHHPAPRWLPRPRMHPVLVSLALGLATSLILALVQGYDMDWDVLNYHFYNGWAFLHGATWRNIQPAMQQSYFAPFMDAIFAALVMTLPATGVALALATFQSSLFTLIFLISRRVLAHVFPPRTIFLMSIALAFGGVASPVNIVETGGAYGDNTSAILVLASVYLALLSLTQATPRRRTLLSLFSGACAGMAVALKLTNAPYAVGLAAAVTWIALSPPEKHVPRVSLMPPALCLAAIATAFALLYGGWGIQLWIHFHNPAFPHFNNIFRSPFAPPSRFDDPVFAAESIADKLRLLFLRHPLLRRGDFSGLFDLRLAITFPVSVAALGVSCFEKTPTAARPNSQEQRLLIVFFLASLIVWLSIFHVNRYSAALELLSPTTCAAAFIALHARARLLMAATLAVSPVFIASALLSPELTWRPSVHRQADGAGYFGLSGLPPATELEGSTVAMLGDRPTAFIIPFFPRSVQFVRLQGSMFYDSPGFGKLSLGSDSALRHEAFGNATGQAICNALHHATGKLWVLRTESEGNHTDEAALSYFGLQVQAAACRAIKSKSPFPMSLCPAILVPAAECQAP